MQFMYVQADIDRTFCRLLFYFFCVEPTKNWWYPF